MHKSSVYIKLYYGRYGHFSVKYNLKKVGISYESYQYFIIPPSLALILSLFDVIGR